MGWGSLFGKIAEQFQSRIERLKNEKAKLETEKKELEGSVWNAKRAVRLTAIDRRLSELGRLLENKASDN